jgi:hypothetical protein
MRDKHVIESAKVSEFSKLAVSEIIVLLCSNIIVRNDSLRGSGGRM